MKKIDELEKALRNLPTPDPLGDLKARCMATIPASATVARPLTWKERIKMPATRTAIAVTTVICVGALISSIRPGVPNGAAVFAASLEAIKKVPYYHVRGRSVGFWPGGGYQGGDGWYTGRWLNDEAWFDTEYGLFSETNPLSSGSGSW